jgi:hypothetical protein
MDTGIVPVAPTSDDCSLFDCPDDRFDPIEQFPDQLVLSCQLVILNGQMSDVPSALDLEIEIFLVSLE